MGLSFNVTFKNQHILIGALVNWQHYSTDLFQN